MNLVDSWYDSFYGRSAHCKAATYTGQHRKTADSHPCLGWDLNLRSQCLSGQRQFMPPLWLPVKFYFFQETWNIEEHQHFSYSAEMSFNSGCRICGKDLLRKCGAVKVNWVCPEIFCGYIIFCWETINASQWVSSSGCHFFTLILGVRIVCHWSSEWTWTVIVKPKD